MYTGVYVGDLFPKFWKVDQSNGVEGKKMYTGVYVGETFFENFGK
jgi:exo-beta-1,3-glucanase (GH17 family)